MNEMVTLRSFTSSTDLGMVKSYLESCGIECYVTDELINWVYWGNVSGGVKLEVRAEQAEEAIKLLLEAGYLKKEDFEPSPEMKWMEKLLNHFKRK
jgi:dephospho-CoA kinase